MTGVDVAAIRARCSWLRWRGKDLTQAETDRADMVSLYDELFEVYVAVTARAKAAEQQRDDALAKIARVEAALEANHRKWKLAGLSPHDFALHHAIAAALTDPRPPTSTPTAETVPPRVAGTGGPQNPVQSCGGAE